MTEVTERDISEVDTFVGRAEAMEAVDLVARVGGFLEAVRFEEGAIVSAGDVLFRVDPDEDEAAVALAKANVANRRASLRETELAHERAVVLAERDAVSEALGDEAIAVRDTNQGPLEGAEAALGQAKLNLSYTTVIATIDGRNRTPGKVVGRRVDPDAHAPRPSDEPASSRGLNANAAA